MKVDSESHSKDRQFPFGAVVDYFPISARDQARQQIVARKSYQFFFSRIRIDRGMNLERRYSDCRRRRIGKFGIHRKSIPEDGMQKKVLITQRKGKFGRWYNKIVEEETTNSKNPLQYGRRENFSGHSPGEAEMSPPTDSRDDIEARRDLLVYLW